MKDFFGIGRNPSLNNVEPSPMRRKLLQSLAYLPAAPLLAMLGGCDDTSTDVLTPTFEDAAVTAPPTIVAPVAPVTPTLKIPLPPFKTTDAVPQKPVAKPSPTTVQVTRVPDKKIPEQQVPVQPQLPTPTTVQQKTTQAKPTKMKVGIYSLQYNSFTQVSTRREVPLGTPGSVTIETKDFTTYVFDETDSSWRRVTLPGGTKTYEGIEAYIRRALDNRFALVYRAMVTAFAKHSPTEFDVSFFTAPEFYWNIPFGDFTSEAELQISAKLCLDIVTSSIRTLISKFPAEKYGKIVMLPGTIAVLKADPDLKKPDGTLAGVDGVIYNATNQVVCTHNLPLDDANYPRPAYMIWPKRAVSHIDYIDEAYAGACDAGPDTLERNPINPDLEHSVHQCTISVKSNISVSIATVSSAVSRSFDKDGKVLSDNFQNDIVQGLPFGIDICLDYSEASVQRDKYRISQLDERDFILNFQLAAGMRLNLATYATTPFIQYAIYNEGLKGSTGATAVWKLNWVKGLGKRLGSMEYEDLAPLEADSPTDKVKGIIAIDQTDSFVAPVGSDTTGIPKILDAMNTGIVRVWSFDVDTSDSAIGSMNVAARNAMNANRVHFIE